MRSKSFLLYIFLLLFIGNKTYADSPLTEIDLWKVYVNDIDVKNALKSTKMDQKNINFLLDENNSVETRLAVVNAIGWRFKSSPQRSNELLKAILKKYQLNSIEQLYEEKYASILSIYSYSLALENYLDVKKALEISKTAARLNKTEPIIDYIYTLILSQDNFNTNNWCNVYSIFEKLSNQKYFQSENGKAIMNLTYNYVGSYKHYCLN